MIPPRDSTARWSFLSAERVLGSGTGWHDLEQAIRGIPQRADWPNEICDLVSPSGQVLSIGVAQKGTAENPLLAEDLACANHQPASGDPPYRTVVGDRDLDFDSGGVVVFRRAGTWTEILRRHCVPVETMVRMARHFIKNESLPDWIAWEDV